MGPEEDDGDRDERGIPRSPEVDSLYPHEWVAVRDGFREEPVTLAILVEWWETIADPEDPEDQVYTEQSEKSRAESRAGHHECGRSASAEGSNPDPLRLLDNGMDSSPIEKITKVVSRPAKRLG